jgi:glutathione S-transferase
MKLYHAPASPYVRKVMVLAHETGLADKLDVETVTTSPAAPDAAVAKANPVKKIPALLTDDGMALFDSPVICEYLDSQHEGPKMFPAPGTARWHALQLQAAADGLLDAAILIVYEGRIRPEELRFQPWVDAQQSKIDGALAALNGWSEDFGDRVDIGTISAACACGYLDLRFPDMDWRGPNRALATWYERFSARPSMQATKPAG